MASNTKQRLALAIIEFLETCLKDGTLADDDRESIEVAQSCIAESFKVDASNKAAIPSMIGDQNLLQIYNVYEKLKMPTPEPAQAAFNIPERSTPPTSTPPTDAQKKEAESLKSQGNAAMAEKNYPSAIDLYSKALAIVPGNPIFLSNRAAAYSASKDHESAKADAEAAVSSDPKYTKAWSRLGLARFALGDAKGSMEAYQKGIDYEGNGGSDAMKKGFETAKKRVAALEAGEDDDVGMPTERGTGGGAAGGMPDLSSLAGLFGNRGRSRDDDDDANGLPPGMPDLGALLSNPMFASMAQNLMSNPEMMSNIMSNPRLRDMANQFGGGSGGPGGRGAGGMPDLAALMQDPNLAEMARNMMNGAGRGRGAGFE